MSGSAFAQGLTDVGSYTQDARAARIAELKIKYKINLSDSEKADQVTKCDTVKDSIKKIAQKVEQSTKDRTNIYNGIVSVLISLRALLADKQIDASNLELLIVDYQSLSADFDVATTTYTTALEDSLSIDCKLEPDNFRASIEGIREGRKATAGVADEIDQLTRSNLKTVFDTIKQKSFTDGTK